eukprot:839739-Lingulodinium_polyedra.AAC.1
MPAQGGVCTKQRLHKAVPAQGSVCGRQRLRNATPAQGDACTRQRLHKVAHRAHTRVCVTYWACIHLFTSTAIL